MNAPSSQVTVALVDADATRAYGRALAGVLRPGDLVVLTGGLGAGKTTLTQGIGAGLGVRGQVASPTFIIARVHPPLTTGDGVRDAPAGPALVHVDAYRIGSLDELEQLDLDTSLDESVTVVEWGEGLVEALADDRLEITVDRARGAAAGRDRAEDDDDDGTGAGAGAGERDEDEDESDPAGGTRTLTIRAIGPRWAGVSLPT